MDAVTGLRGQGPLARTHARVRTDAAIYPRGNFIMDATVRLSHGRPSSHRPCPHPSVRLTTMVIIK
jgi:hypothetical protein